MSVYDTMYSNLTKIPKKERKQLLKKFPFTATSSRMNQVEWCGSTLRKNDLGAFSKFCPLCDEPMIVKIMFLPCQHVVCYSCSIPEPAECYVYPFKQLRQRSSEDGQALRFSQNLRVRLSGLLHVF